MPRDAGGAAGGRAAQDAGATGPAEDLQALLARWKLESSAAAFAELGVERVSHLEWMLDSDVEQLKISTIAKRISLAMLKRFREQNAAEPAQKKVKREEGPGEASGAGGPSQCRAQPLAKGGDGGEASDGAQGGVGQDAVGDAREFQVIIEGIGARKTLEVFSSDTIAVVKRKIQRALLGPAHNPLVEKGPLYSKIYAGRQLLEDGRTLAWYSLQTGSLLQWVLSGAGAGGAAGAAERQSGVFQIHVKTQTGKTVPIDVYSSDTIDVVKILVQAKEAIPVNQMRFVCAGQQLEDGHTLVEYKIVALSVLFLTLRLIGDIGEWGAHSDAAGTRFLQGDAASPQDARAILRALGVTSHRMFESSRDAGLDARARAVLVQLADSKHPAGLADFKLQLSRGQLAASVGEKGVRGLETLFRVFGGDVYTVWLRRSGTRNPKPETRNPRPETLRPLNPEPETGDSKFEIPDPKPYTREPQH